jgi:hypothetical protein
VKEGVFKIDEDWDINDHLEILQVLYSINEGLRKDYFPKLNDDYLIKALAMDVDLIQFEEEHGDSSNFKC